ncbi:lysozyme inhibitor LprI family protein [Alkalihalobacillus sp. NPDC078783]
MRKWIGIACGLVLVSVLTACSDSTENQIVGTWQFVLNGEKEDSFIEIEEDRVLLWDDISFGPEVAAYRIFDLDNDQFLLEIAESGEDFEFGFEGFFDSKDRIVMGLKEDTDGKERLIRIDSIEDAIAELEKELERELAIIAKEEKQSRDVQRTNVEPDAEEDVVSEIEERVEEEEPTDLIDEEEIVTSEWPELAGDSVQAEYSRLAIELENRMYEENNIIYNDVIATGFYTPYYEEWDELLNEIWSVLKNQMPEDAFEILKESQLEWINQKETNFAEMPSDVAVERTEGMDYLTHETMYRTYYLIYNYMDYAE